MDERIRQLHLFLKRHSFYALAFGSALTLGLLTARIARYDRLSLVFLVWNLALAWVPYLASLWAAAIQRGRPRAWWWLLPAGAIWLLFFPNALYLVTDLVHLRERPPVPLWYDIGLLTTFVLNGCWLAVVSLHHMQELVRRIAGTLLSWLFVLAASGLSGLGVYMGRVLRWNSWDVLIEPRAVLADAIGPLLNPRGHVPPLALSAVFTAVLLICYAMYLAAYHGGRMQEER